MLITKIGNWRTVAAVLISAAATAYVLKIYNPEFAPVLWHLSAGGLMFGAFFMATDPVSCPSTNAGKWIFGILIGSITILIRNFTGYVEGMMFALLLGNTLAPLLDEIFHKLYLKRLNYEA